MTPTRGLVALVAVLALLGAGYLLWLRDSDLVAVKEVSVTGLSGNHAPRARRALEGAALASTTLHVDHEAIERAVEGFPTIRRVEIETSFPHGLAIRAIEHRPAAVLVQGSRRAPVAGDGTLLTGLSVRGELPEVRIGGPMPKRRIGPGPALDAARVAGAAPAGFTARIERVVRQPRRGLVVRLREGPELIFGGGSRLGAKWAGAARVLADPDATGADYVDVRLPGRPAAGGLPVKSAAPVAPGGAGAPLEQPETQAPAQPQP